MNRDGGDKSCIGICRGFPAVGVEFLDKFGGAVLDGADDILQITSSDFDDEEIPYQHEIHSELAVINDVERRAVR